MGKKRKSGLLSSILIGLIFFVGLGLILYPTVSNWWNEMHSSRTIDDYQSTVYSMDAKQSDILYQAALAYNQYLSSHPDRWHLLDGDLDIYYNTMDVTGTGIMGYLNIPKIGIELPVYHGTKEDVLQLGVGHMEGSSLPIGGLGTHSVLSGHTGLASAKLFTKLDQMEVGDTFTISVLSETLTYQVVEEFVTLPDEMEYLDFFEGKDYCTLITCTPYGVNSHRLLVRGERIETVTYEDTAQHVPAQVEKQTLLPFIILVAVDLIAIFLFSIWILVQVVKKRRERG